MIQIVKHIQNLNSELKIIQLLWNLKILDPHYPG